MKKPFYLIILTIVFNVNLVFSNIYYVTNVNDNGSNSLREAVNLSNINPGLDTIYFNIPGTGPFIIPLNTSLPIIIDPVFINGFSQPGNSAYNYLIDIRPTSSLSYIFQIRSSNTKIQGLKFSNFNYGCAISIDDDFSMSQLFLSNISIQDNYFYNISYGIDFLPSSVFQLELTNIKIQNNIFENLTEGITIDFSLLDSVGINNIQILNNRFLNFNYAGQAFNFSTGSIGEVKNILYCENRINNVNAGVEFDFSSDWADTIRIDSIFINKNYIANTNGSAITIRQDGYDPVELSNIFIQHDTIIYNENGIDIDFGGRAVDNISNITIENNIIADNQSIGIYHSVGSFGTTYLNNFNIRNNKIINNGYRV